MAQDAVVRQGVLDNLAPAVAEWVEGRLQLLLREQNLSQHPALQNLARVVLALGAQGEAVLVGRGAGFILPRETTLHVRLVAPLPERIAYMSQELRLTVGVAAEMVRLRDERRGEFLRTHFHRNGGDVHPYDMLLNTSLLGEDVCAELIALAARSRADKETRRQGEGMKRQAVTSPCLLVSLSPCLLVCPPPAIPSASPSPTASSAAPR